MRVFLDSEEYGFEDFEAEDMDEAIRLIKELHRNSVEAFKLDHVERRVGIVIE